MRTAKGTKNLVIFETTLIVRDIDSLNPPILHFIQTHSCKDVHEFSTQERKRKLIIIVIVMIIIIIVVVKCKNKLRNFKTKEKR